MATLSEKKTRKNTPLSGVNKTTTIIVNSGEKLCTIKKVHNYIVTGLVKGIIVQKDMSSFYKLHHITPLSGVNKTTTIIVNSGEKLCTIKKSTTKCNVSSSCKLNVSLLELRINKCCHSKKKTKTKTKPKKKKNSKPQDASTLRGLP